MEGRGDDSDNDNDTTTEVEPLSENATSSEALSESATSEAFTEENKVEEKISTTETSATTTLTEIKTTTTDLAEEPTTVSVDEATNGVESNEEDDKKDAEGGEFESEMVDGIGAADRDPGEKCRKCERSGWRSRHASFCSECQSQEMEKLRKKCEKCSRKGFAFRNIDFCETMCGEDSLKKSEETTTVTTMCTTHFVWFKCMHKESEER